MKIYSIEIKQTSPVQQTIYCPPHSTFFIAPKVIAADGTEQQFSFLDGDGDEILPYPDPLADRTVYAYVSGEPSVKNLKLVVPPQNEDEDTEEGEDEEAEEAVEVQTYVIKLVTTTSTVFDVDLAGESGGAKPQDAGPGITITDRGVIAVDSNVIPTYEGSSLHLGFDKEVDLDSFATEDWVNSNFAINDTVSDIQNQLDNSNNSTGERAREQWQYTVNMSGEYADDGEPFSFEVCVK